MRSGLAALRGALLEGKGYEGYGREGRRAGLTGRAKALDYVSCTKMADRDKEILPKTARIRDCSM